MHETYVVFPYDDTVNGVSYRGSYSHRNFSTVPSLELRLLTIAVPSFQNPMRKPRIIDMLAMFFLDFYAKRVPDPWMKLQGAWGKRGADDFFDMRYVPATYSDKRSDWYRNGEIPAKIYLQNLFSRKNPTAIYGGLRLDRKLLGYMFEVRVRITV